MSSLPPSQDTHPLMPGPINPDPIFAERSGRFTLTHMLLAVLVSALGAAILASEIYHNRASLIPPGRAQIEQAAKEEVWKRNPSFGKREKGVSRTILSPKETIAYFASLHEVPLGPEWKKALESLSIVFFHDSECSFECAFMLDALQKWELRLKKDRVDVPVFKMDVTGPRVQQFMELELSIYQPPPLIYVYFGLGSGIEIPFRGVQVGQLDYVDEYLRRGK